MAIGLALGGGAPNLPLMTGALLALDEAGIEFKVITTTGAGMVVGLLYAAPRRQLPNAGWVETRRAALRATRDWGIDDLIYEVFPINYKIFQKPGRLAEAYAGIVNPPLWSIPRETRRQRLLGDWLAFWAAAFSPSSLTHRSRGLCQPPPWIEILVDFGELRKNLEDGDRKFRLSAFCIDDLKERTFDKHEITADHFKAALAMPFIYEPYPLPEPDGTEKHYLEGSAFRPIELDPGSVMAENGIDTIICFDVMGDKRLIAEPRWLVDAWGKSIVAPLTRLAKQDLEIFKLERERHHLRHEIERLKRELDGFRGRGDAARGYGIPDHALAASWRPSEADDHDHDHETFDRTEVLRMKFRKHIPKEHWPYVLDWSWSNMSLLFDVGLEAGRAFVAKHGARLAESMRRDPGRGAGDAAA